MLVVKHEPQQTINLDKLTGKELFVYRCKTSNTSDYSVAVLTKLRPGYYGFIALDYSTDSNPRYETNDWRSSLIAVIDSGRKLYCFNSQQELIKAIYHKEIL